MSGLADAPPTGAGCTGRRDSSARWLGLVVLGALLAYGTSLVGDFVYDDHHSVRENEALRSLAAVPQYFIDVDLFSSLQSRMYRPVLLATFAVNWAMGAGSVVAFKVTDLLLHALCAGLVYALARRLGAAGGAAAAGGLFFAVHPLAAEAVNMVSARSEQLMVAAVLAGLVLHCAAMRGRRSAVVGTAMCAVVATGAKETGVVLPALMLVLEAVALCQGERPRWATVVRRLLPAVLVVLVYLAARKALFGAAAVATLRLQGGTDPLTGASRDLVTQLATMATLLPRCLLQLLVPVGLSLDPPIAYTSQWSAPRVWGGAVAVAAATVYGLARPRSRPLLCLATCVAWATSLPWIVIPLNLPLAEHRLYGLIAGAALGVAAAWPALGSAMVVGRRPGVRVATGAATGALVLWFVALSASHCLAYRDERTLWDRTLAINPASHRAAYSIGAELLNAGRPGEAKPWLEHALALYPDYIFAQKNLVEAHLRLGATGDPAVALAMARQLRDREPHNPFRLLLLSRAYAAMGARSGDAELFDRAVEIALEVGEHAPLKGLVFRTAAHARRTQGDLEGALALLDAGVARGFDHSSVLLDRFEVLRALGREVLAAADLREAMRRDPFDPRVVRALAR
ncbi:MAG: hypothetical protein AAF628_31680 [Planctomycetota bacterium]